MAAILSRRRWVKDHVDISLLSTLLCWQLQNFVFLIRSFVTHISEIWIPIQKFSFILKMLTAKFLGLNVLTLSCTYVWVEGLPWYKYLMIRYISWQSSWWYGISWFIYFLILRTKLEAMAKCIWTLLMLEMKYSCFGGQYHARWCPGPLSRQAISRHGIDNMG